MTRPRTNTIDYFPHTTEHGKTMFIIEQRYGNDGYAFWFKLLELLGRTENHFLDLNDPALYEYLLTITRITRDKADEILTLLSVLSAIDQDLWKSKIIWCQNFVDGVSSVYTKNRHTEAPRKPDNYAEKPRVDGITTPKKPQSKVKESKVNTYSSDFEIFWKAYPKKSGSKKAAFDNWNNLNGDKPAMEIILDAIKKQTEWRNKARDGDFRPEWKDPERWIKNKMWEVELEEQEGKSSW
jgi:hypothetical protein